MPEQSDNIHYEYMKQNGTEAGGGGSKPTQATTDGQGQRGDKKLTEPEYAELHSLKYVEGK